MFLCFQKEGENLQELCKSPLGSYVRNTLRGKLANRTRSKSILFTHEMLFICSLKAKVQTADQFCTKTFCFGKQMLLNLSGLKKETTWVLFVVTVRPLRQVRTVKVDHL